MKKRSIKIVAILMALICVFCAMNITAYADEMKSETVSVSYSNKLTTPKVKISVISSEESTLKLSWDKVEGANKYYIYRRDTKSGSLKLVAKTSKLYYKDTNVSKNKTYYYKVRAYQIKNNKVVKKSDTSSIVSKAIVSLAKVKNVKATAVSDSKIKISWDKVSGATRYYLYYATSKNGTYKSIGYVTKNSYTFSKLNSSTTYYFKVQSAKKLDSKVYKASYSPIASAKTNSKNGEFIVEFDKISNKEAGLPTGSAITCLSMILNHYGVKTTPKELLPYFNCSDEFYYKDGELWGPSPDDVFVGDPTSDKAYSYGIEISTVSWLLKKYLVESGKDDEMCINYSMTASDSNVLKEYIHRGNICLAILNMSDSTEGYRFNYIAYDGVKVLSYLGYDEKYVILCGYTNNEYIFYDPVTGKYEKWDIAPGYSRFSGFMAFE